MRNGKEWNEEGELCTSLHLKPFLDHFCERTYMEAEDLEVDPLETVLGCVVFGKLLICPQGCLFSFWRFLLSNYQWGGLCVSRGQSRVVKITEVAHEVGWIWRWVYLERDRGPLGLECSDKYLSDFKFVQWWQKAVDLVCGERSKMFFQKEPRRG